MKQQIQELGELVKASQKILLINHIRMDGDAWGSLGGLALLLQNMGKEVIGINDDPVPDCFAFLGHQELIQPDLDVEKFDPDIIISLDTSDPERHGEVFKKWKNFIHTKTLIVIDHHVSNPGFGDLNIIDPEASSVCEIVTDIISSLGWETYANSDLATLLYTGLQTDSNMYFNTNTRPNTLRAGAKLMELGADFRAPVMEFYKKRTQNQIRFWQHAFEHIKYHNEGQICSCILDMQGIDSLGISMSELSGYTKGLISEILINISGVKIAYLIYPLGEDEIKVSMRSREGYDVATICEYFGGGGHRQAAGFQSEKSMDETEKNLLGQIAKKL